MNLTAEVVNHIKNNLDRKGISLLTDWVHVPGSRTWMACGVTRTGNQIMLSYVGDFDKVEECYTSVFTTKWDEQIFIKPY